ncbi:MAG: anti-sigma factor [Acidobacteriota bacterium]|nr:anti-sigma factor [Acidobacteriota bacterium]
MSDHTPDQHDFAADAAAYAMGALEPAEAEAFRRHLDTCAACAEEVASFESVVRALPLAASQYGAPHSLRRRVMREVRAERAAPTHARGAWPVPRPIVAGVCAVALVAAAVVGAVAFGGRGQAPTHVYAASVGDAVVRVSGARAELIVRHLPQPRAGRIYEVWLKHGDAAPRPTRALFGVDTAGRGDVVVPGSVHGVTALLVTAEPAGGSRVPTSTPVIVASLG